MNKLIALSCLILLTGFVSSHGSKEEEAGFYVIQKGDMSVNLTNYGATIVSYHLPDKHGKMGDIVLGYDSLETYKNDDRYFSSIIGRVANRIAGAQFTLNGKVYKLEANSGNNSIHGGSRGFGERIWKVKKYQKDGHNPHVVFTYHSRDGEAGFPGDLNVTVTFSLIGKNKFGIHMNAKALNKPTPVNLAHHVYWNLGGHNSGNILDEEIQIFGSRITAVDETLIPTGELVDVKGTPYDFLKPKAIGKDIDELARGYDINYALDGGVDQPKRAAIVYDKKSGRKMNLITNAPGMQFFTANSLEDLVGKGGFLYQRHAGFCLETQGYPDAVNHPNFPSTIVTPEKDYNHFMLFKFTIEA